MRMFPPAWVRLAALALAAALVLLAPPGSAKTLRLASAFDPQTLDPHALTLLYHSRVITQVYEGLVSRDRDFRLEPALAVSWDNPSPTTWRFRLRPGVRFHDGSPLTADDVVFSVNRAMARTSQRAVQLRGINGVRRIDDLTVEVQLAAPDAVLPEKFWLVAIMSRAWSEKNGVAQPQDFNAPSARSTWASTRRATSWSSRTSRAATRSRTCGCGRRFITRSTRN